jgi:hypothetical protein
LQDSYKQQIPENLLIFRDLPYFALSFCAAEVLNTSTGSDGKQYDILCLPFEYCLAWMLGINAANVKEEIREKLLDYQKPVWKY